MLFNSGHFLLFFPIVTLVYFILPARVKQLWLLAASYYFYACWNTKYLLLLFASTVITYLSGLALEWIKNRYRDKQQDIRKKLIVALSFILNIGLLCYFKYTNFFITELKALFLLMHINLNVPVFDIVLPVGISFYIFQALSYTMDVYRDEIYAEKNFFRYALFVSFFPQLVAGPIERSKNLLRQLAIPGCFRYENVRSGLLVMLWGFFLKLVIADRCALLVNNIYNNYMSYQGYQLITAHVLFALQIYCDFMGYSMIAVGAGRVLGYRLMDNFAQPYFAVSIKDFWRRWHISLSSWLRDYLYIPLGGSRGGRIKRYRNIIITFFASGLWHGAGLNFVVWGLIHGFYLVVEDIVSPLWERCKKYFEIDTGLFGFRAVAALKTFILADIAWIFFRADSLDSAIKIIQRTFYIKNIGLILNGGLLKLGLNDRDLMFLLVGCAALFTVSYLKEQGTSALEWLSRQNIIFRYGLYWACITMIIFSLDLGGQEFIYFRF